MPTLSIAATVLIVIATVLPLSKNPHWLFRGMDFPRLQVAVLAALLLFSHLFYLDFSQPLAWCLFLVTGLCLCWQGWWVMPYTRFWPREVKTAKQGEPEKQLSIITSNVLQTNKNSAALIALVQQYQPDILVTLESDQWWEGQLAVLEQDMPYTVKCPLDNLYGMHVYSRLPFTQEEIAYLVEADIPSIHLYLELRTGDKVHMHFLHPAPPSPTENPESMERDAELVMVAKRVAETCQPVIVTGDLNDVAWSDTTRLFRKISGLLDPRVGRGMFNTFHVGLPFLRWPLDHLFHSPHFTVKHIQRLPSIGSDHFSLFTVLVFDPVESVQQEGLTASDGDHAEAERIQQAKDVCKDDAPRLGC